MCGVNILICVKTFISRYTFSKANTKKCVKCAGDIGVGQRISYDDFY